MSKVRSFLALGFALLGCNEQTVDVELRSLQASDEMTFVCLERVRPDPDVIEAPDEAPPIGYPRSSCPDRESDAPTRTIYSLITQTATDEVAVVDVLEAQVVDVDKSVPGYTFLRLPSRPGDIVTSPGGVASFVGLTGVGKTGITALPTSCLGSPVGGETVRDATTFPACSLPSVPGDMAVLVEPPGPDGIRVGCAADSPLEGDTPPPGALRSECKADLTAEMGPSGRRKLLVALPEEGRLVVIDAQGVLDGQAGEFPPCVIEASFALASEVDPAGQDQNDVEGLHEGCAPAPPTAQPVPPSFKSTPAGFALDGGRLFVADRGVPLVHVLDVSSACNLEELPSLLPMSFEEPSRVVTTSRVAVSPLTPSGKRFVYAVDEQDRPAASVMAFDVSPTSSDRTPLVRRGSVRNPFDEPDRLEFVTPVADVTFALRDLPASDQTGVAPAGLYCDPDPTTDPSSPGAQYRSRQDYTQGARPELLRGLFAFVLLTNGDVAVIDVDDFDAPCRRPSSANPFPDEDFRGCAGDPEHVVEDGYVLDGRATVTDEISCNLVEPHRQRSSTLVAINGIVGSAPSLRALPQFSEPNRSEERTAAEKPKLRAVNFESPDPAEADGVPPIVYVGDVLYTGDGGSNRLNTDPGFGEEPTLSLPLAEARNYPPGDTTELTYEGQITGTLPNGFFEFQATVWTEDAPGSGLLSDSTAAFCEHGVYDEDVMRGYAASELGVPEENLDAFAEAHADYVQITGDFPAPEDPYWSRAGVACDRQTCLTIFGATTDRDLQPGRELRIVRAYQDHLDVVPRANFPDGSAPLLPEELEPALDCCFPTGTAYTIRASRQWVMQTSSRGFLHDVIAEKEDDDPVTGVTGSYRCVRDCSPRKRLLTSRAFEITADDACGADCGVGERASAIDACSYDPVDDDPETDDLETRGVALSEPAAACVFENVTARFAVYRGLRESVRDMRFRWDTVGGFNPLAARLTSESAAVLPQHVEYLPELQGLMVIDAASIGLSFVSLDTLRVDDPWPVN